MTLEEATQHVSVMVVKAVGWLGLPIITGVQKAIEETAKEKTLALLKSNTFSQTTFHKALGDSLEENHVEVEPAKVAEAVQAVQSDLALVVNVENGGTGRILTNGAEETIYGSQQINVRNGGVGEVVDGAKKTIISKGGTNPALSVNVTNEGTGIVGRAWIDKNGQTHGGIVVRKIIE